MNILKEARERQGFTQIQMAQKLGLGLSTIRFYETNRRHVKACELLNIASWYGMSDEEILVYLRQISK